MNITRRSIIKKFFSWVGGFYFFNKFRKTENVQLQVGEVENSICSTLEIVKQFKPRVISVSCLEGKKPNHYEYLAFTFMYYCGREPSSKAELINLGGEKGRHRFPMEQLITLVFPLKHPGPPADLRKEEIDFEKINQKLGYEVCPITG